MLEEKQLPTKEDEARARGVVVSESGAHALLPRPHRAEGLRLCTAQELPRLSGGLGHGQV